MDSMINRYTADRKLRHDDAYTADNVAGKRPDRATLVYTQRCKEAWKDVPVIPAASKRACAVPHTMTTGPTPCAVRCWWDSKADMLIFGNGERPLVEVAHRLAQGEAVSEIRDVRNTAIMVKERRCRAGAGWIPALSICRVKIDPIPHPYGDDDPPCADNKPVEPKKAEAKAVVVQPPRPEAVGKTYVLLPSHEKVKSDKVTLTPTRRASYTMKPTPAARER